MKLLCVLKQNMMMMMVSNENCRISVFKLSQIKVNSNKIIYSRFECFNDSITAVAATAACIKSVLVD